MRNSTALKTLAGISTALTISFAVANDANATRGHEGGNRPQDITNVNQNNIDTHQSTRIDQDIDLKPVTNIDQDIDLKPVTNINQDIDLKPVTNINQDIDLKPVTDVDVKTGPTNVTVINQGQQGGGGPINTDSSSYSGVKGSGNSNIEGSGNSDVDLSGQFGGKGGSVGDVEGGKAHATGGNVGDIEGSKAGASANNGPNTNDNANDNNNQSGGGSVNQNYGRPGAMPGILGSLGPNLVVPQECGSGFGFSLFGGAPYLLTIGGGMSQIDTGFKFENGHTVGDILGADTTENRQKMMAGLSSADNRRLSCVVGYAQIRMAMQEAGYNRQEDLRKMNQDFTMTGRALDHLLASGAPGTVDSFLAMRVDDYADAMQNAFHALRRAEAKGKITRADINSPTMKPSVEIAILEELFLDPAAMKPFRDAQKTRQETQRNRTNANPWNKKPVEPAAQRPNPSNTSGPVLNSYEPGM